MNIYEVFMNLDVEKRRINAKLADPVFVADFEKFVNDISFDGELEITKMFEQFNRYSEEYVETKYHEMQQKAQETVSQLIDDFYQKHGTDYADAREFLFVLKETLRLNLKSKISSATTAAAAQNQVVVSPDIEEKRAKLLSYFGDSSSFSPSFMDQYLIRREIAVCSPEKLQRFLDKIKIQKDDKIKTLEEDIEKYKQLIQEDNFLSKSEKFGTERLLEDSERILQYYKNVDDLEVFIPLSYKSNLGQGNSLTSELIDKNIDVSRFDDDVRLLQFMNNLVESYDRGLVAQNAYFNGSRIIDKRSGKKLHLGEVDARDFVSKVSTFSREQQTNFAYNPQTVKYLIEHEKEPIAGFSKTNSDGSKDKFVVYSFGLNAMQPERTLAPFFVKHVQEDPAKNTFSVMMYVFEEPDLRFGTQLFRIDKVPPIARWGAPAAHRQASGNVIVTNVHVHDYDLFDRVLINTNRPMELGHSDISNNFITDNQLDNDMLELFVNQKFNIEPEIRDEFVQDVSQNEPAQQQP